MTKKDFIALADTIQQPGYGVPRFYPLQIEALADFCESRNPRFRRSRWLGYINGDNGPCGGIIRKRKPKLAPLKKPSDP